MSEKPELQNLVPKMEITPYAIMSKYGREITRDAVDTTVGDSLEEKEKLAIEHFKEDILMAYDLGTESYKAYGIFESMEKVLIADPITMEEYLGGKINQIAFSDTGRKIDHSKHDLEDPSFAQADALRKEARENPGYDF